MTKDALIQATANATGDTIRQTTMTVEAFMRELTIAWVSGGEIQLRGFGTMSSKQAKARIARNPQTGEVITIPARRRLRFKIAGDLHKRVK
jgi:DNA-binding protein HU-beta